LANKHLVNLPQNYSYAELAHNMDPALVIVLSEHLGWVAKHSESFPHSENISQSRTAWLSALDGFAELEQKFTAKLVEWREKWQQRFEIEGIAQIVANGANEIKKIKNAKDREQQAKLLYLSTMHLMIGDAQKQLTNVSGDAWRLQEHVRKIWHKNCPSDSYSKILPSIENSFQDYEEKFFENKRNSLSDSARQEFLETIMANENCNLVLNFYFSSIFRQVSKISAGINRFYSKKWALYARGFGCRQNLLPLG